ncbi:MAG: ribonuclease HII [Bacteroidales bacterium]
MLLAQYGDMEWEAGVDEAGRGCLAGPVFAAAVIFPKGYKNNLLNDSKKLSEKLRYSLREEILKEAISYGVASVDASEIDQINILQASIKAMHKAATQLNPQPNYLIVDGNRFKPYNNIPYSCIVKGDAKYLSIAAASILAKTYRDDYMLKIHQEYPFYAWDKNKAYPTQAHYQGIKLHGITPYHRRSFRLYPELTLF